jgi:hypothetical protein
MFRTFVCLLVLGSCTGSDSLPDEGPPPTLTGPLLAWDSNAAAAANSDALPSGFTVPQPTICATDTTRGFLSELFVHGISNPQVAYEWAPVIPGPTMTRPTIEEPEFYLSGAIKHTNASALDFRPAHPFGFDVNWDITMDDPFIDLVDNRAGDSNDGDTIHTELESGLFPGAAFGFAPGAGDRALLAGSWILDCGHPAYETELHPPTFAAFARADGAATVAVAFAQPYRTTQLYGPVARVDEFDDARFDDPAVAPFTTQFEHQALQAGIDEIEQIEFHALVEATRFEPLTWFVCAPEPRPAGAALDYSYRFVTRTGVTVTAAQRGTSGCLRFHAEIGAGYVPATPSRADYMWFWDQVSAEASAQYGQTIDVRQTALTALAKEGFTGDIVALHADVPILVDQYPPLAPRAGADADAPTAIVTGADDQPFPFYGRIRVAWR